MAVEVGGRAHRDCPTYKIFECIDMTETGEFWELDDKDQAWIQMMLSCGAVDSRVGYSLRTKLESLFPIGTTTRTNLDAMFLNVPPVLVP